MQCLKILDISQDSFSRFQKELKVCPASTLSDFLRSLLRALMMSFIKVDCLGRSFLSLNGAIVSVNEEQVILKKLIGS